MDALIVGGGTLLVLALFGVGAWYASKKVRRSSGGMRLVKFDHPCCHLRCSRKADWLIVYGAAPLDYTEACTKHVGELLCDAKEQSIYPIHVREAPTRAEREAACQV